MSDREEQTQPAAWNSPDFEGSEDERGEAMVRQAMETDASTENQLAAQADLDYMRMFEQRPMTTLYAYSSRSMTTNSVTIVTPSAGSISPMNVLRAVISTGHAMLARSKVRGRFLTTNGTGKQKSKAQSATTWLDGWTAENKVHGLMGQCLLDAMVCQFGVVQVFEKDKKIKPQRILPLEIVFDRNAAIHGLPDVIYRKRPMSTRSLIAKFCKKGSADKKVLDERRAAIMSAEKLLADDGTATGMVLVWEGWSLPTSEGADDGWHAIGIDKVGSGCLEIGKWTKTWFPLIFIFWDKALAGFGGVSLAAQLETMQTDLNFMHYIERKAMRLFGVPRYGADRGAKIISAQMTNQIGGRVDYSNGKPPVPLVWPYLSEQFFREKGKLVDAMYSIPGISRNMAEGTKPEGTESGAAQREAMETQNVRVQIYADSSWESPHVELYEKVIEMAADIDDPYTVLAPGRNKIDEVDFKSTVALLKKRKITCYPSGFLPLTPAARLDFILTMLNGKIWDVDRARAAMADLDVESEQTLENSIQRMFNGVFEGCLYDGKPARPNELAVGYFDIAIKTGAVYMALAENEEIEQKNIDLAQRYLDELRDMKTLADKANPPPAPAAPAAPVAPPAGSPMPA